jgi:hypothetical protein
MSKDSIDTTLDLLDNDIDPKSTTRPRENAARDLTQNAHPFRFHLASNHSHARQPLLQLRHGKPP